MQGDESACAGVGLTAPDPGLLAAFRASAQGSASMGQPVCQLPQIDETPGATCANASQAGWCYVVNAGGQTPAGACNQAIVLTSGGAQTAGAALVLACP
jgi:hypothetical protein